MQFEIGREYDRLDIAREFGFSEDRQSMRGGLFFRNDTVLLIKDEKGNQYEDRWDPYRPGTILYYATLKHIASNKDSEIRDLPIKTGANKEFMEGTCPIILFSKTGNSYRYMGEFQKSDSNPRPMVKNGYRVPGCELVSKDPGKIEPYIREYLLDKGADGEWTQGDIDAFRRMYVPGGLTSDDVANIAVSIDRPVATVRSLVDALDGKASDAPKDVVDTVKQRLGSHSLNEVSEDTMGLDKRSAINVRVGQAIFRHNLDVVFGGRCCITGITKREVLKGSHVMPWSSSTPAQRMDPNNGLLLNAFHDSLFDKFLMTVRPDGAVEYIEGLEDSLGSVYDRMCAPYDTVEFPEGYVPRKEAYEFHNRCFDDRSELNGRS